MAEYRIPDMTMKAALAAAGPGDTIIFDGPGWGAVSITGKKVAEPGVTFKPGPKHEGRIAFRLLSCEGVRIEGFKTFGHLVSLSWCNRMAVTDCAFPGNPADYNALGLQIYDCQDVLVKGCSFSHLGWAIQVRRAKRLTIEGNQLFDLAESMRDFQGCEDLLIENNEWNDLVSNNGLHIDCMQLWTGPTPTVRATIRGNRMFADPDRRSAQFIFLTNPTNAGFIDLVIERNACIGPAYHGCTVQGVKSGRIVENFVQAVAGGYYSAWIQLDRKSISPEVEIRGNWTSGNAVEGDDFVGIPWAASFEDRVWFDAWVEHFNPKPKPPATLEDAVEMLTKVKAMLLADEPNLAILDLLKGIDAPATSAPLSASLPLLMPTN